MIKFLKKYIFSIKFVLLCRRSKDSVDCSIISVKFTRSAKGKMPPKETRRCLRYPVNWEVKTCNSQPVEQTLLLDISAIGAKIEGPRPLYQERHVEFTYLMPGDDKQRRHTGVVMWMRPLFYKPGRYQMGVEFYQPDWSLDLEMCAGMV